MPSSIVPLIEDGLLLRYGCPRFVNFLSIIEARVEFLSIVCERLDASILSTKFIVLKGFRGYFDLKCKFPLYLGPRINGSLSELPS